MGLEPTTFCMAIRRTLQRPASACSEVACRCGRSYGCACRAPRLTGQVARQSEHDQSVDAVKDADAVRGFTDPREHDLDGDGNRYRERPQNT